MKRTLERIDVEALVVPVEFFIFESLLDGAPLCIVRGDDPVRNVLLLEMFRDDRDGLDLFWILVTQLTRFSFDISPTHTHELFPSASSFSVPFISTKRHAVVFDFVGWSGFDLSSLL